MGLDYVDIFYHHRPDPGHAARGDDGRARHRVRSGKALYVGISSYSGTRTAEAVRILRAMGTPLLIHQPSYSMLNRWVEEDLLDVLGQEGVGCIAFSPLAQGMLTDRYLDGIPADSRAALGHFLKPDMLTDQNMTHIRGAQRLGPARGQTLAQLALAWVLRDQRVTSVLIGASSVAQLEDNVAALELLAFTAEELAEIDRYAVEGGINLWRASSNERAFLAAQRPGCWPRSPSPGCSMRLAVTSVGAVLDDSSTGCTSSGVDGLITTLPVICFADWARVTPRLSHRVGPHRLLVVRAGRRDSGLVLRAVAGSVWSFSCSASWRSPVARSATC